MGQSLPSLENIGDLLRRAPKQGYWVGAITKKLGTVLTNLPIALPKTNTYLFSVSSDEMMVSGITQAITSFRIVDAKSVDSIENNQRGARIYLTKPQWLDEHNKKITSVLLLSGSHDLPSTAVSLESLTAPVELLDEYAALTQKLKAKSIAPSDIARRDELISLIGSEYERRRSVTIVASKRSTPTTSGESRGIFSYRGG